MSRPASSAFVVMLPANLPCPGLALFPCQLLCLLLVLGWLCSLDTCSVFCWLWAGFVPVALALAFAGSGLALFPCHFIFCWLWAGFVPMSLALSFAGSGLALFP